MCAKIRILSDTAVNQIAAGEVIENPASCVKEILENAIDAGASKITIETHAAGHSRMVITDNGSGMVKDDLLLSVERHATSKLGDAKDLETIATLGFRGEALASIASVSKCSIHSRHASEEVGTRLYVEGGKMQRVESLPRQPGTTVAVHALFFNTPVRKKFLKGVAHDKGEIAKVITNAALCHPEIAFEWSSDGREELLLPATALAHHGGYETRVEKVLGASAAEALLSLSHEKGELSLFGFIGKSGVHRANRRGQHLLINRRPILSKCVSEAVLQGYHTRLPTGRFPLFVLHLTLPSSQVDVNVHPQKKEVRFADEVTLGRFVVEAVEKTLQKTLRLPTFTLPAENYEKRAASPISFAPPSPPPSKSVDSPSLFEKMPTVLLQFGRYLVVDPVSDGEKSLWLIDDIAARRRLFFDAHYKPQKSGSVQPLLVPITVELMAKEKRAFASNGHHLAKLGFECRDLGGNTLAIDAIPTHIDERDMASLIEKLLSDAKGAKSDQSVEKNMVMTFCRSLRSRSRNVAEAGQMITALLKCEDAFTCPLGKKIVCVLTEKDFANMLI